MSNNNVVQIPFSAFKLIDLGQSIGLEVYQAFYNDHTEPVGMIAVTQAMGLIHPSDEAVHLFNRKWTRGSARWKLHETGIEVVTGKSSTTGEMAKTRDGEATVMVLSFLSHRMRAEKAAEIVRAVIDSTPPTLVPIKPRRAQVENVVTSVEAQTSCVNWQTEIAEAERTVFESPQVWLSDSLCPEAAFDIPTPCAAAFYQALCTMTKFPKDYYCVLETGGMHRSTVCTRPQYLWLTCLRYRGR
jgi:hypothetical protein